jgi:hypothetical protein
MRRMVLMPILFAALALVLTVPAAGEPKQGAQPAVKDSALERFKQLTGEWVGKKLDEEGKAVGDVSVKYHTTSGGSAVVETIMPGSEHEMVTVIHPDGKDLVLTHYCMLGNQPHMKAASTAAGNRVAFQFTGASNMKTEKDMHMHAVTYTFVDANTLRAAWNLYVDGRSKGTVVFEVKRQK